jgi:hypothetical protein
MAHGKLAPECIPLRKYRLRGQRSNSSEIAGIDNETALDYTHNLQL